MIRNFLNETISKDVQNVKIRSLSMIYCKLNALRWILRRLSIEKEKRLGNASINIHFNYAPLIWMFSRKWLYLKMQRVHQKNPEVIYQSNKFYWTKWNFLYSSTAPTIFSCWNLTRYFLLKTRVCGLSFLVKRIYIIWEKIKCFDCLMQDQRIMELIPCISGDA